MRKNLAYIFTILGILGIIYYWYWEATYPPSPVTYINGQPVLIPGDYVHDSLQILPIYWGGIALFIVGLVMLLRSKKSVEQ